MNLHKANLIWKRKVNLNFSVFIFFLIRIIFLKNFQILLERYRERNKYLLFKMKRHFMNGLFQKKSVPPVENNGIPGGFEFWKFQGVERKKLWKIPGGGESFDGIPGGYCFWKWISSTGRNWLFLEKGQCNKRPYIKA